DRIGAGWGNNQDPSSNTFGPNVRLNHGSSPQRIDGEETRSGAMSSPGSPGLQSMSSTYPSQPLQQSYPLYPYPASSQSSSSLPPQHQRHRSTDESLSFARIESEGQQRNGGHGSVNSTLHR